MSFSTLSNEEALLAIKNNSSASEHLLSMADRLMMALDEIDELVAEVSSFSPTLALPNTGGG